jgi:hypothetical protein
MSMVDPLSAGLLAATVTGLARGVGGEAGKRALTALADLVRNKFGHQSHQQAELEAVQAAPQDKDQSQRLAGLLAQRAGEDPDFGRELQAWLADVHRLLPPSQTPTGTTVTNIVGGSAQVHGHLVQGEFHGPVSFGGTPPAEPTT